MSATSTKDASEAGSNAVSATATAAASPRGTTSYDHSHRKIFCSDPNSDAIYISGQALMGSAGACGKLSVAYACPDYLDSLLQPSSLPSAAAETDGAGGGAGSTDDASSARRAESERSAAAADAPSKLAGAGGAAPQQQQQQQQRDRVHSGRRKMVAVKRITGRFGVEVHALKLLQRCRYVVRQYEVLSTSIAPPPTTPSPPQSLSSTAGSTAAAAAAAAPASAATATAATNNRFCIITEFCAGGDMATALAAWAAANPSAPWLPEALVRRLFAQIAVALLAAKEQRIMHRDLKLENIFLSSFDLFTAEARLGDFGLAKMFLPFADEADKKGAPSSGGGGRGKTGGNTANADDTASDEDDDDTQQSSPPTGTSSNTANTTTTTYRDIGANGAAGNIHTKSPERLARADYSFGTDVWSLALLLYEMLCGCCPWPLDVPPPAAAAAPARGGNGAIARPLGTEGRYLQLLLARLPAVCRGPLGDALLASGGANAAALFAEAAAAARATAVERKGENVDFNVAPDGDLGDPTAAALFFPYPAALALSAEAKDLMLRMFTVDPSARITIEGVLSHPWLAGVVPPATTSEEVGAAAGTEAAATVTGAEAASVAASGESVRSDETFALVRGPYPAAFVQAVRAGVRLVPEDDLFAAARNRNQQQVLVKGATSSNAPLNAASSGVPNNNAAISSPSALSASIAAGDGAGDAFAASGYGAASRSFFFGGGGGGAEGHASMTTAANFLALPFGSKGSGGGVGGQQAGASSISLVGGASAPSSSFDAMLSKVLPPPLGEFLAVGRGAHAQKNNKWRGSDGSVVLRFRSALAADGQSASEEEVSSDEEERLRSRSVVDALTHTTLARSKLLDRLLRRAAKQAALAATAHTNGAADRCSSSPSGLSSPSVCPPPHTAATAATPSATVILQHRQPAQHTLAARFSAEQQRLRATKLALLKETIDRRRTMAVAASGQLVKCRAREEKCRDALRLLETSGGGGKEVEEKEAGGGKPKPNASELRAQLAAITGEAAVFERFVEETNAECQQLWDLFAAAFSEKTVPLTLSADAPIGLSAAEAGHGTLSSRPYFLWRTRGAHHQQHNPTMGGALTLNTTPIPTAPVLASVYAGDAKAWPAAQPQSQPSSLEQQQQQLQQRPLMMAPQPRLTVTPSSATHQPQPPPALSIGATHGSWLLHTLRAGGSTGGPQMMAPTQRSGTLSSGRGSSSNTFNSNTAAVSAIPQPAFDISTFTALRAVAVIPATAAAVTESCTPFALFPATVTHLTISPTFVGLSWHLPPPPVSFAAAFGGGGNGGDSSAASILNCSSAGGQYQQQQTQQQTHHLPFAANTSLNGSDVVLGMMRRLVQFTQKYHRRRAAFLSECCASDVIAATAASAVSNSSDNNTAANNKSNSVQMKPEGPSAEETEGYANIKKISGGKGDGRLALLLHLSSDVSDEIAAASVGADPLGFLLQMQWAAGGSGVVLLHDVQRAERKRNADGDSKQKGEEDGIGARCSPTVKRNESSDAAGFDLVESIAGESFGKPASVPPVGTTEGEGFSVREEASRTANVAAKGYIADSLQQYAFVADEYDLGTLEQYTAMVHVARERAFIAAEHRRRTATQREVQAAMTAAHKAETQREKAMKLTKELDGDEQQKSRKDEEGNDDGSLTPTAATRQSATAPQLTMTGAERWVDIAAASLVPMPTLQCLLGPQVLLPETPLSLEPTPTPKIAQPFMPTGAQQQQQQLGASRLLPGFPPDEVARALTPILIAVRTIAKVLASTRSPYEDRSDGAFGEEEEEEGSDAPQLEAGGTAAAAFIASKCTEKALRGFDAVWAEDAGGACYDDAYLLQHLLSIDPRMIYVRRRRRRGQHHCRLTPENPSPPNDSEGVERREGGGGGGGEEEEVPLSLDDVELALALHTAPDLLRFWADLLQQPYRGGRGGGQAAAAVIEHARSVLYPPAIVSSSTNSSNNDGNAAAQQPSKECPHTPPSSSVTASLSSASSSPMSPQQGGQGALRLLGDATTTAATAQGQNNSLLGALMDGANGSGGNGGLGGLLLGSAAALSSEQRRAVRTMVQVDSFADLGASTTSSNYNNGNVNSGLGAAAMGGLHTPIRHHLSGAGGQPSQPSATAATTAAISIARADGRTPVRSASTATLAMMNYTTPVGTSAASGNNTGASAASPPSFPQQTPSSSAAMQEAKRLREAQATSYAAYAAQYMRDLEAVLAPAMGSSASSSPPSLQRLGMSGGCGGAPEEPPYRAVFAEAAVASLAAARSASMNAAAGHVSSNNNGYSSSLASSPATAPASRRLAAAAGPSAASLQWSVGMLAIFLANGRRPETAAVADLALAASHRRYPAAAKVLGPLVRPFEAIEAFIASTGCSPLGLSSASPSSYDAVVTPLSAANEALTSPIVSCSPRIRSWLHATACTLAILSGAFPAAANTPNLANSGHNEAAALLIIRQLATELLPSIGPLRNVAAEDGGIGGALVRLIASQQVLSQSSSAGGGSAGPSSPLTGASGSSVSPTTAALLARPAPADFIGNSFWIESMARRGLREVLAVVEGGGVLFEESERAKAAKRAAAVAQRAEAEAEAEAEAQRLRRRDSVDTTAAPPSAAVPPQRLLHSPLSTGSGVALSPAAGGCIGGESFISAGNFVYNDVLSGTPSEGGPFLGGGGGSAGVGSGQQQAPGLLPPDTAADALGTYVKDFVDARLAPAVGALRTARVLAQLASEEMEGARIGDGSPYGEAGDDDVMGVDADDFGDDHDGNTDADGGATEEAANEEGGFYVSARGSLDDIGGSSVNNRRVGTASMERNLSAGSGKVANRRQPSSSSNPTAAKAAGTNSFGSAATAAQSDEERARRLRIASKGARRLAVLTQAARWAREAAVHAQMTLFAAKNERRAAAEEAAAAACTVGSNHNANGDASSSASRRSNSLRQHQQQQQQQQHFVSDLSAANSQKYFSSGVTSPLAGTNGCGGGGAMWQRSVGEGPHHFTYNSSFSPASLSSAPGAPCRTYSGPFANNGSFGFGGGPQRWDALSFGGVGPAGLAAAKAAAASLMAGGCAAASDDPAETAKNAGGTGTDGPGRASSFLEENGESNITAAFDAAEQQQQQCANVTPTATANADATTAAAASQGHAALKAIALSELCQRAELARAASAAFERRCHASAARVINVLKRWGAEGGSNATEGEGSDNRRIASLSLRSRRPRRRGRWINNEEGAEGLVMLHSCYSNNNEARGDSDGSCESGESLSYSDSSRSGGDFNECSSSSYFNSSSSYSTTLASSDERGSSASAFAPRQRDGEDDADDGFHSFDDDEDGGGGASAQPLIYSLAPNHRHSHSKRKRTLNQRSPASTVDAGALVEKTGDGADADDDFLLVGGRQSTCVPSAAVGGPGGLDGYDDAWTTSDLPRKEDSKVKERETRGGRKRGSTMMNRGSPAQRSSAAQSARESPRLAPSAATASGDDAARLRRRLSASTSSAPPPPINTGTPSQQLQQQGPPKAQLYCPRCQGPIAIPPAEQTEFDALLRSVGAVAAWPRDAAQRRERLIDAHLSTCDGGAAGRRGGTADMTVTSRFLPPKLLGKAGGGSHRTSPSIGPSPGGNPSSVPAASLSPAHSSAHSAASASRQTSPQMTPQSGPPIAAANLYAPSQPTSASASVSASIVPGLTAISTADAAAAAASASVSASASQVPVSVLEDGRILYEIMSPVTLTPGGAFGAPHDAAEVGEGGGSNSSGGDRAEMMLSSAVHHYHATAAGMSATVEAGGPQRAPSDGGAPSSASAGGGAAPIHITAHASTSAAWAVSGITAARGMSEDAVSSNSHATASTAAASPNTAGPPSIHRVGEEGSSDMGTTAHVPTAIVEAHAVGAHANDGPHSNTATASPPTLSGQDTSTATATATVSAVTTAMGTRQPSAAVAYGGTCDALQHTHIIAAAATPTCTAADASTSPITVPATPDHRTAEGTVGDGEAGLQQQQQLITTTTAAFAEATTVAVPPSFRSRRRRQQHRYGDHPAPQAPRPALAPRWQTILLHRGLALARTAALKEAADAAQHQSGEPQQPSSVVIGGGSIHHNRLGSASVSMPQSARGFGQVAAGAMVGGNAAPSSLLGSPPIAPSARSASFSSAAASPPASGIVRPRTSNQHHQSSSNAYGVGGNQQQTTFGNVSSGGFAVEPLALPPSNVAQNPNAALFASVPFGQLRTISCDSVGGNASEQSYAGAHGGGGGGPQGPISASLGFGQPQPLTQRPAHTPPHSGAPTGTPPLHPSSSTFGTLLGNRQGHPQTLSPPPPFPAASVSPTLSHSHGIATNQQQQQRSLLSSQRPSFGVGGNGYPADATAAGENEEEEAAAMRRAELLVLYRKAQWVFSLLRQDALRRRAVADARRQKRHSRRLQRAAAEEDGLAVEGGEKGADDLSQLTITRALRFPPRAAFVIASAAADARVVLEGDRNTASSALHSPPSPAEEAASPIGAAGGAIVTVMPLNTAGVGTANHSTTPTKVAASVAVVDASYYDHMFDHDDDAALFFEVAAMVEGRVAALRLCSSSGGVGGAAIASEALASAGQAVADSSQQPPFGYPSPPGGAAGLIAAAAAAGHASDESDGLAGLPTLSGGF